jgi:oligopeptide transport system substrate-binding protein
MYRFLLFVLLMACSSPKKPETLRVCFSLQPNTLDPRKAGDFSSSTLICMIYEGLTRCVPGGEVEPALAERVEISPDGKTYLFHLRKAFWSNGNPITAYDFERAWKGVFRSGSSCTYLFYPLKNGEKCAKGKATAEEVGVQALDDKTLCVELERPTPYFYSLTAFPSFLPAHGEDPTVYSGPFRIETMTPHAEIVLVKNLTYWNAAHVFLDQIHISIVSDEMTALHMFERGELDWLGGPLSPLPPDPLDQFQNQLHFVPSAATTLLAFNTQTFPFHNAHLRQAFSYAIDRTEIVEKVTIAGQIAATSLLPPAFSDGAHFLPKADGELARLHLQQALEELQLDASELAFTLYFKSNQVEKRLAQTLQRQWQEVLGIPVQLIQLDLKSHAQRLQSRDYQISLASWIAQFDDPVSILDRFKDKANLKNYVGWENAAYSELLTQAASSPERIALLKQAEALLAAEMPVASIYHWRSPALCSPCVSSVGTTPCGGVLFESFRLER